ncbi:hypothetical protein HMPREF1022_02965 [Desulfovibrio sp. 6_1_46AFAA]|uniref:pentapeptide repeat-containing protein n=1 Tax=Desulfovibrio sp. 6_1_46AFAA TaxID=665942 RepID=UPI0002236EA2|nr:pentapeptide repeat-containing protein [Desulfovibrio sp. 6_1_46AFAA]EGW50022.1 hypothetical protein HMPREF1022_02965 [Desulfovibrio sp. 6_1_46AFAA]
MNRIAIKDKWGINSNLSYETIKNCVLEDKNINRSLFNGSTIDNCIFKNCKMQSVDIEGAIISKTKFISCDLASSEIQTIIISDSVFYDISFVSADIETSTFRNCKFINCKFDESKIKQNIFISCIFFNFNTNSISGILNKFNNVIFYKSLFIKYFYYNSFICCSFKNTTFEAYLLGYSFGITKENINSIDLLFMEAKVYDNDKINILRPLSEIYEKRGMYLNIGILAFNYGNISNDECVLGCIVYIKKYIENCLLIKADMIKFFREILFFLYESKKIVPLTILQSVNMLDSIIDAYQNQSSESTKKDLIGIRNELYIEHIRFMDEIAQKQIHITNSAQIEITYKLKPSIDICSIINSVAQKKLKLIKTSYGSFIELISISQETLLLIQTFFSLLNVFVPFFILKLESKQKSKKYDIVEIKKDYYITKNFIFPSAIDFTNLDTIEKLNKVLINYNFLKSEDKFGYNQTNITNINIFFDKDKKGDDSMNKNSPY